MRTMLIAVLCMLAGPAWACGDDVVAKRAIPSAKQTTVGSIVTPVIEAPKPVAADEKLGPSQ